MEQKIFKIEEGSVAEELELEAGDTILSVDGQSIEDVFDWRTLTSEEEFTLLVRKTNGEEWEVDVEIAPEENLGIVFENDLMSDYKSCSNQCIFCFIDQMPPHMRETLYFKDDDSRLSFLQGNYITLTNMKEADVDRIIRYRMEPMNISVHTTNPDLRVKMLHNRFAGRVLSYLDKFYEANLQMNAQIVLCKGWNDGEELRRTAEKLFTYAPVLQSVSVVPVGLTKYRDHLEKLEPFRKEDAIDVIRFVEDFQKKAYARTGLHFLHAADEFYILAGMDFPPEETYDDYPQLENGVGMATLFLKEAADALAAISACGKTEPRSFATGMAAAPLLKRALQMVEEKCGKTENRIFPIRNDFFGEQVTVAGLVTGQDLIHQLKDQNLGNGLYLPSCMFRSGEDVFLDDLHSRDIAASCHTKVHIVKTSGASVIRLFTGTETEEDFDRSHGEYERREKDTL